MVGLKLGAKVEGAKVGCLDGLEVGCEVGLQ